MRPLLPRPGRSQLGGPGGRLRFHAPYGYDDLLGLVGRPKRVLAPREVYEEKAARWSREWPQLAALPW